MARSGWLAGSGRETDVAHQAPGDDEHHHEDADAEEKRDTERRGLGDDPAEHRAAEHGGAGHHLPASQHRFEIIAVVGEFQCVDQPGVDRAGEEREPEPDQHRDDRPRPERGLEVPHQVVEERRAGQRQRPEQVGNPPPPGVGNDAGRNFEDDHAGSEEGVGGKGLEVAQARVEKEQRVDPPDERGREGVAEHQRQVCALDAAGQLVHRSSCSDAASSPRRVP